jgi:hypothetical protein
VIRPQVSSRDASIIGRSCDSMRRDFGIDGAYWFD